MSSSVLIVAAEASSSLYAQRLLEKWRRDGNDVQAFGIGSRDMEKVGFECLGRSEDLAVVGLQEVLAHLPQIAGVFHRLLDEAQKRRPKFALLLDYPDFNFRLAKRLKALGIPVVYYISPQIWAWRRGRIKLVRKYIDRMLVLFPFEEDFYRQQGVQVDFVGHPALDEIHEALFDRATRAERRARFGIGENDMVLALMPGSRNSEIKHHLQTMLEAARLVVRQVPNLRPLLLVAPTLERERLRQLIGHIDIPLQLVKEAPFEMIALADVVLVASGTATLMVGLMEKPMVIMYRMSAVTAWLARCLVRHTKFFGMVNLIMDKQVVPELFQDEANPARLAEEIVSLLTDSSRRAAVCADLRQLKNRLGSQGATDKVAKSLAGYFT